MKATITFEVKIPDGVSHEDAERWIRYEIKDVGELRLKGLGATALVNKELVPVSGTLLIDFEE